MQFVMTGDLKKVKNGLVDYIAEGKTCRDCVVIPCEVGFTEFPTGLEMTYAFIKEGCDEYGNHWNAETIKIGG